MTTPDWVPQFFKQSFCSGKLYFLDNKTEPRVTVKGVISERVNIPTDARITYWAANPAQRGISPASGYPYANVEQAFDRSPNIGKVPIKDGKFEIDIIYPSAYYSGLGSVLIPPTIHIKIEDSDQYYASIRLGEEVPFRTLTYPSNSSRNARDSPLFYYNPNLPIRGQEAILRSSAYPSHYHTPNNFWGYRPPN
jgi:hypothetical protein